ncbi:sugar-binding transcriptional regulator [Actinobaculum suis]|uniref:sugar-binding transcriptional regulator n=1 Tax=Actinobaculum suis TaxID=1657 RepID=UPI000809BB91|nr:sugar-binding domain-containing protein [Actinobaculum suis]OCA93575.1 hypothetical protein ACU20_08795 [Actinobaculum suis]
MVAVAKAFYLGELSKVEISDLYNITRFKVARLLEEARNIGIVKITVAELDDSNTDIGATLAKRLGLKHVIVVASQKGTEKWYDGLAVGAASLLENLVKPATTLGISWGRTLVRVGLHLKNLPQVDLVQLTGVIGSDPNQSPMKVMSNIPNGAKGRSYALFSPLFSSTAASAARLRKEPNIQEVFAKYDSLDVALLSVGSWENRITQLTGYLTDSEIAKLDDLGAVADCAGLFIDANGNYVQTPLNERRISISFSQLQKVPNAVAVAGEPEKARAIIAVSRARLATHLVTTQEAAFEILHQLDASEKK